MTSLEPNDYSWDEISSHLKFRFRSAKPNLLASCMSIIWVLSVPCWSKSKEILSQNFTLARRVSDYQSCVTESSSISWQRLFFDKLSHQTLINWFDLRYFIALKSRFSIINKRNQETWAVSFYLQNCIAPQVFNTPQTVHQRFLHIRIG